LLLELECPHARLVRRERREAGIGAADEQQLQESAAERKA
jgi:hypothetical protein